MSEVSYPCDYSPCYQVYRRDLQAGTTQILSAAPKGDDAANQGLAGFLLGGQISADGCVDVFLSAASNLSRQPDTNNGPDIFFTGAPRQPRSRRPCR